MAKGQINMRETCGKRSDGSVTCDQTDKIHIRKITRN